MNGNAPTAADLRAIVREALRIDLQSARRFRNGLCHFVYDVKLSDSRRVVVRIARLENRELLVGAVHWSKTLRPIAPLPELICARLTPGRTPFPYIVLSRIPGRDLGAVYTRLSIPAKKALAEQLARVQGFVRGLPRARRFGFQSDPKTSPRHRSWADFVDGSIERSAQWIVENDVVDGKRAEKLRIAARRFEKYFAAIEPGPFLDDITTKNVLISRGRLSGIVDVDMVCYGDHVAHLGLTRMALLSRGWLTDYVDYWCQALKLNPAQMRALDFYTAESCLGFLAEVGRRFNRKRAPSVDRSYVQRLENIFDRLMRKL